MFQAARKSGLTVETTRAAPSMKLSSLFRAAFTLFLRSGVKIFPMARSFLDLLFVQFVIEVKPDISLAGTCESPK